MSCSKLERNGARTIALIPTDAQGSWSATATLERNAALRALHRPYPASVSDWQKIAVAPAITLEIASTAPLQVSGTISPGKRRVTIDVYPAGNQLGKPLSRTHLGVRNGAFTGKVRVPSAGSFVLIARSASDSTNAAGASAPVPVTVS